MRTYEDVKSALKFYHDELIAEASAKQPRYIIVGGNMSVIKKGATQYVLGKGNPVPMVKETAKKKIDKFQERCGDNIKLEIIRYNVWLNDNIKECNHLIACMQKSLSGDEPETPIQIGQEDELPTPQSCPIHQDPDATRRGIEFTCPTCPFGINTCMTCKFALGIDMQVYPWAIICNAPKKPDPEEES